jgi:hypothetical protein
MRCKLMPSKPANGSKRRPFSKGDIVPLHLTGRLVDGRYIEGEAVGADPRERSPSRGTENRCVGRAERCGHNGGHRDISLSFDRAGLCADAQDDVAEVTMSFDSCVFGQTLNN